MDMTPTLLKTVRSWALSIALTVGASGCYHKPPEVIVSPVADPLWLEKAEPAPYQGWLVTQGWIDADIEDMP